MPLHVWLPYAHPAAPSHLGVMSGVMIKTAIYGLIRVYFDFMGEENSGGGAYDSDRRHGVGAVGRRTRSWSMT